ncbi:MAG TPA: hypothetical protein VF669_13775 [Tepidisphaeraceae bacterium]
MSSSWLGGYGSYTDSTKWSGNVVPRNTATDQYNVDITASSSVVNLEAQLVTVNQLTLGSGQRLSVNMEFGVGTPASFRMLQPSTINGTLSNFAANVRFDGFATLGSTATLSVSGAVTPYNPAFTEFYGGGTLAAGGKFSLASSNGSDSYFSFKGGEFISDGTIDCAFSDYSHIVVDPGATFLQRGNTTVGNRLVIKGTGFKNTGTISSSTSYATIYFQNVPVDNVGTINTSKGGHVAFAGTVSGNGTVSGYSMLQGAMLSPGNSVGHITFSAGAEFDSTTQYLAELAPGSLADLISVTGDFNPAGAKLSPTGGVFGETYTIAEWTGSRTGTFALQSPNYLVTYNDTSKKAFVTLVPEPGVVSLVAAVALLASRRTRR